MQVSEVEMARAAAQQAIGADMPVLVMRFTEQQLVVEPAAVASTHASNGITAVEKLGWHLEHFNLVKRSGNQWTYAVVFRRSTVK